MSKKKPSGSATAESAGMGPAGATGFASTPEAICRPALCPACTSSRRVAFRDGPVNEQWSAVEVDGQLYNHVIWRNTSCIDCGQRYRVLEYRNDPPFPPIPPDSPARRVFSMAHLS